MTGVQTCALPISLIITGNLEKDAKTFEALEPGAGDKLRSYVKQSVKTYQLSLRHFLYSNFDSVKPFLKSEILKHGVKMTRLAFSPIHSYVRKHFTNPRLQQILEYPTVFLGSSPYSAPALYSLMSALDFDDGVYYPKGTMYAVVESLVKLGKSLGVSYHLNSPVVHINGAEKTAQSITLKGGKKITADIIISNSDFHFTETKLLSKEHQSYPAAYWKNKEASPSALLIYLGVEGKVPEFEHHTLLFTKNWKDNFHKIFAGKEIPTPASLYISKTSQSDDTAPKGKENIFVLVPLPSGISISSKELTQLADDYLEQIKQTTGVDLKGRTLTRTLFGPNDFSEKYNSWQSSMLGPSHRLSQSAFFRTSNRSKKLKNLFYVGATTVPGIGVPMCLISAELVRERITKGGWS